MKGKTQVPDGWELRTIGGLIERVDDIRGELKPEPGTVLSCSKDHGLIPQMELFQRRLASTDTHRYKLVHPGDFVYDPNLLWSGSIAKSHEQAVGIVSPVYEVFRVVRGCSQDFLFAWLKSPSRLPNYRAISMGTNVRRRRADFGAFSKLPILLPPLYLSNAPSPPCWTPSTTPSCTPKPSLPPQSACATPCSTSCSPAASPAGTRSGKKRRASGRCLRAGRWCVWGMWRRCTKGTTPTAISARSG